MFLLIHIVFGQSAGGSVRMAFEKLGHQVIVFPITFSVGPLTNLAKPEGIDAYFDWLERVFGDVFNELPKEKIEFKQALQAVRVIAPTEKVMIWTCENASEQTGLCFVLAQMPVCEVFMANTQYAIDELYQNKPVQRQLRSSGEVAPEKFSIFYNEGYYDLLTERERTAYIQESQRLLASNATLRSWLHGVIIDERETRDDAQIIECAKQLHRKTDEPFLITPRLIGEMFGHSDQDITDSWIEYRIRTLIAQGVFYFEGDLKSMRMYKVRLNEGSSIID